MPIDMRIWRIQDDELKPVTSEKLLSEASLEDWLAKDISMVSEELLVIGRQLTSDLGGNLDLLAIDRSGDLAVLELKRDLTPRDVVAQALHYAAWIRTLSWEQVNEIAAEYFTSLGAVQSTLGDQFKRKFGEDLPESVNSSHRIYIVAAEMDAVSESIVRYLSEEYGVSINTVFFRLFRDGDAVYLGRSWLMEPLEVDIRGETSQPRRRHILSLSEFMALAEKNGVRAQYEALLAFFSKSAKVARHKSNIAFVFQLAAGSRAAFSVYPGQSSKETGLRADVRPEMLAEAFRVSEETVRGALPPIQNTQWGFGEIRSFRTMHEVNQLLGVLSGTPDEG